MLVKDIFPLINKNMNYEYGSQFCGIVPQKGLLSRSGNIG